VNLSTLLGQKLGRGYEDSLLSSTSIGVLAAILATAFVGPERLAGVAALAWTREPDARPRGAQPDVQRDPLPPSSRSCVTPC
jgi:hypothetical protein